MKMIAPFYRKCFYACLLMVLLLCDTKQVSAQELRSVFTAVVGLDTLQGKPYLYAEIPVTGLLKPGQKSGIVTSANKTRGEDFDEILGQAVFRDFSKGYARFEIELRPDKQKRGLLKGDMVKIEVRDTVYQPEHFTGFILNMNLQILDANKLPFFTPAQLAENYKQNPVATDKWLIDTLYQDLIEFYYLNENIFEEGTFTKPITKGRYTGRTVQDIFKNLRKEDLENFLWFMISFPGKYIGVPYKFNETFATWLINFAPAGGHEVLRYYHEAKEDSLRFRQTLKNNPWILEEKGLAYNTGLAANENRYYSEKLSDSEYSAAIWYSEVSGDMRGAGLAYLFKAENDQNKANYPKAFLYCERATKIYETLKDYDRLLDLYFKQAYLHYTTSGYDAAFEQLEKVYPILKNQIQSLEDYTPEEGWSKYYDYKAFTFYKAGRYTEALLLIDSSALLTENSLEKKALKSRAFNESLRGNIYKKQEAYQQSIEAYQLANTYYKKAGDNDAADALENDLGILLFKQGRYAESNQKLFAIIPVFLANNQKDQAGLSYSQIGQNYWNLKLYDSAIASHNLSIDLRRQTGNRTGQAFSWEQLGTLYQKAGIKAKALAALDSAAFYYEASGNRAESASLLLEAGKVYLNDKEYEKAETYYLKAAHQLAALGKKDGYSDALFELGSMTMEQNAGKAQMYFDSCRIISLEAGMKAQAAYSMMNLGILQKYDGKLASGKAWYEEAKKLIETLNEPHAMGFYYQSLGRDEVWKLNLDAANSYYRQAVAIFEKTSKARALQVENEIAVNYQNMGQYDRAEKLLDSMLTDAKAGRYLLELGAVYQNKAWMLLQQGQTEAGLSLADSAAYYYEETGNDNSLASLYALRGDFNRKLFNFTEAFNWYTKSDSLYARMNNPWARSAGMINFVVLFYYQGQYQRSLEYTYQALATRPFVLEDPLYIDLQGALAENQYYLGYPDSSRRILEKYLPVARSKKLERSANYLSLMLGRIAVDQGSFHKAIPLLQQATTAASAKNDLITYQQALAYLGMAYRGINQPDSARFYFDLAVKTAETFEIPSFSWEALYQAGLDAYTQKDFKRAIPLFKEAVAMVNKQAATLYGGEEAGNLFRKQPAKADLYFKLMSALTQTGQKEEAWQYANLSQAAALSDLAGGIASENEDSEKRKALQTAQEKFRKIQSVGNALQQTKKDSVSKAGQLLVLEKTQAIAEADYLNYIEELKKEFPELGTFFANQVNPEKFRNLHTYLPEDMAMLMYVVNDRELMIFWATQENTGIVTGTIPSDFFNKTAEWISALKNPNRPANAGPLTLRTQIGKIPNKAKPSVDVKTGAEQLFALLIEPVLEAIGDKSSWCLIPNGKLTHLPFHALGKTNTSGQFEYIAATKNIFYTNSPNELFLPWNRRNRNSFAAFGNPDNTLQSAGVEVNQIANMYSTAQVYTEKTATVEQATQSLTNMHYVHFATHGVLNYSDFDSSYLVFAPGSGADHGGKLTLYDIRRLNIKGCDLVTLSACETAVSAEVSKGWYISPANAFLINRVRSVVASLWEVDDESTNLLMQSFYKNLRDHSKVEALRLAMEEVSHHPGYEHPFFWAGFVLYGDWQ